MTIYTKCTETVLTIAREMIDKYHPSLQDALIGFLFRDEAQVSKGVHIFATAKKAPAWVQPYADLDFLIIIAEDIWKTLTANRRAALIDHELCHCSFVDGEAKIWAHDFEEFQVIIERHGLWTQELFKAKDKFANAQKTFQGFEAPKFRGKVVTIDNLEVVTEEVFDKT